MLKKITLEISNKLAGTIGKKQIITNKSIGARANAIVPATSIIRSLVFEKQTPAIHIVRNNERKSTACMTNEAVKLNDRKCTSNTPSKATLLILPITAVRAITTTPITKAGKPAIFSKGL